MGADVLSLARFQFAMTTVFHFFFVPLSIGLALAVAIMETMYVIKKDEKYKVMAKFWGKIFLLSFAVGVVTGIIQEFQFGMNWSDYSRFVGDIFGAPLAVEALLAFFLESTFLGLWMFSWDKFSKKVHALFIWMVVLGSMMSAFWILVANSFMQHPMGFTLNNGRAELTDFGALLTNPQVWYEFTHVLFGAVLLGGFVIAGLSALQLLKKRETDFFKKSMKIGLVLGLSGSLLTAFAGDLQTKALVHDQPMKFAATEGLYEDTSDPAPLSLIAFQDVDKKESTFEIEVPGLLSFLAFSKLEGSIKGMNTINEELIQEHGAGDYYPPVKTLFWSFRVMVGIGMLLILISMVGLWLMRKNKDILKQKWFLYVLSFATVLPFIGNTAGWLITELGRYPWTVYGLFRIADSVSPNVSAASLWFSNIVYFVLFAGLGSVMVYLILKEVKKGPYDGKSGDDAAEKPAVDPFEKGAFN